MKDTAQFAVFVRGVIPSLDIAEKLVQLIPMKCTTTGEDIFKATQTVMVDMKLDFSKLAGVTVDGTSVMIGGKQGVTSILYRPMKDLRISHKIKKIYCVIHQEALCMRSLQLKKVMDVVAIAANLILARGQNHRPFQQFL